MGNQEKLFFCREAMLYYNRSGGKKAPKTSTRLYYKAGPARPCMKPKPKAEESHSSLKP